MKRLNIYKCDKTSYAVILFICVAVCDLLAVITGFGGAIVTMMLTESDVMLYSFESLIVSVCVICFIILTIIYAYRNNHPQKLKALGYANLIMSLMPLFINSVYYPFAFLLTSALAELINVSELLNLSDSRFYLSELVSIPMCICCFVLLSKLKTQNRQTTKKNTFRFLAAVTVTVFTVVSATGMYICNTPVSEYFNYSALTDITEFVEELFSANKTYKAFDSITGDTDFSQVHQLLKRKGYIPHTQIKEYIDDEEMLESETDKLKEFLTDDGVIVYTKPEDGYLSYYNKCIIITPDENGKVKSKKIFYDVDAKDKTELAKQEFESFIVGDDKELVLKKLKKASDIVSYEASYNENTIKEVYEFIAFKDVGFLSLVDETHFTATVIFENGIVKDGKYTYTTASNFETDDVIYTENKYRIKNK